MNALSGGCLALAIGPTITNMLEFNRLGATQGVHRLLVAFVFVDLQRSAPEAAVVRL